jgi:hypothetical protein
LEFSELPINVLEKVYANNVGNQKLLITVSTSTLIEGGWMLCIKNACRKSTS